VEGLEVMFKEKDPWGVTASLQARIRGPLARVSFNRGVNLVTEDVWDPRRGFLEASNNGHAFIKSIQMDVGISQRTAVNIGGRTFEVMRTGRPERSIVGGAQHKVAQARARLVGAYYARRRRNAAVAQDQQWFRGQQEEARTLLRGLLNEASQEVLVVDPYFGAEELGAFTLAVARYDIPIRILSSGEVLKKNVIEGGEFEKGEQLLDALRQLERHHRMNPFEIRVMPGDRPAIHDRFLAIDSRVWLLGSSLNEFGSRGTMLLTLPDPDAVRDDLESAWNEASALEPWVNQRIERRKKEEGERT
jgi:hypothetical protein